MRGLIMRNGGTVATSIVKATTYLLATRSSAPAMKKKAVAAGLPIVTDVWLNACIAKAECITRSAASEEDAKTFFLTGDETEEEEEKAANGDAPASSAAAAAAAAG